MATADENAATLRRLWEWLVPPELARALQVIDYATAGGDRVLLERTGGILPPNAHGPIDEGSVGVDHPTYSLASNLRDLLTQMIADLEAGAGVVVEEADGSPSEAARALVLPNGTLAWDPATETMTVTLGLAAITGLQAALDAKADAGHTHAGGGGTNYVYWVDAAGLVHWPTFNGTLTRWEG